MCYGVVLAVDACFVKRIAAIWRGDVRIGASFQQQLHHFGMPIWTTTTDRVVQRRDAVCALLVNNFSAANQLDHGLTVFDVPLSCAVVENIEAIGGRFYFGDGGRVRLEQSLKLAKIRVGLKMGNHKINLINYSLVLAWMHAFIH
jgi:hypothetical protein